MLVNFGGASSWRSMLSSCGLRRRGATCVDRRREERSAQEGAGTVVPRLPAAAADRCAVAVLERWLDVVGASGPIFSELRFARVLDGESARCRGTSREFCAGGPPRAASRASSAGIRCGVTSSRTRPRRRSQSRASSGSPGTGVPASCWNTWRAATLDDDPPRLEIAASGAEARRAKTHAALRTESTARIILSCLM